MIGLNKNDSYVCEGGYCVVRPLLACQAAVGNVQVSPQTISLASFNSSAQFSFAADLTYMGCEVTEAFVGVNPPSLVSYPLTKQSTVQNGERWGATATVAPWGGLDAGTYPLTVSAQGTCSGNMTLNFSQTTTAAVTVTP